MAGSAKDVPSIEISFQDVTPNNVKQLRMLNLTIFPVKYTDQFYKDVLKKEIRDLVKLAYHNGALIGAVCCRYEPCPKDHPKADKPRLYIMTLGVLAPYRAYGVGSHLLRSILEGPAVKSRQDLVEVYLHVQVGNEEALNFYRRHGFEVTGTIENYYHRIEPADCYVVTKAL